MKKFNWKKVVLNAMCLCFAILLGTTAMGLSAGVMTVQAQEEAVERRVLFISSYSYAKDAVKMQIEGIESKLDATVKLDYEFMDMERVATEESAEIFYEGLKYRLSQVKPYDVVIVGDDEALSMVMEHREELFAGIPVVFEGINDEELAKEASKMSLTTGIVEKPSLEENIQFGLTLNPDAKKVMLISDNSVTARAERARFYECAKQYSGLEFSEINTSGLSALELGKVLGGLSEDTILLYSSMTTNKDGKLYSTSEAMKIIADNASVPCLSMVEVGVGEGVLGGKVVSMSKSGEIAGEMAMTILRGKSSESIAMVNENPNVYYIDEAVMKKYDLNMDLVPEGAIIVNHEETFFERNTDALKILAVVAVVIVAMGVWIGYDVWKRNQLVQALRTAQSMIQANKEAV